MHNSSLDSVGNLSRYSDLLGADAALSKIRIRSTTFGCCVTFSYPSDDIRR